MDFMADQLSDGRRIRILTLVDIFIRESLAADPRLRQTVRDVVETLNKIVRRRGTPNKIFCDNGSKFSGSVMDLWAYQHEIKQAFCRPGKPTNNAYI
jgi:putative transposase